MRTIGKLFPKEPASGATEPRASEKEITAGKDTPKKKRSKKGAESPTTEEKTE